MWSSRHRNCACPRTRQINKTLPGHALSGALPRLAVALTNTASPPDAQGMEREGIGQGQFPRVENNLVCGSIDRSVSHEFLTRTCLGINLRTLPDSDSNSLASLFLGGQIKGAGGTSQSVQGRVPSSASSRGPGGQRLLVRYLSSRSCPGEHPPGPSRPTQ